MADAVVQLTEPGTLGEVMKFKP